MIEELIFTSSQRGLQIGKSGFCTVASTPEMAPNLARMLESLSGYRHLFTPGAPEAKLNPVVYSLLQVKVGGHQRYIMSRVADAGIDYSGRSNKIAHHVSLPVSFGANNHLGLGDGKTAQVGPTRLLLDKQFFCRRWEGEARSLPRRSLLTNSAAVKPCKFWSKVTGDAGWAGDFIEACQTGKVIYLIISPSTPAIALLHEAMSLLPPEKQWQTTFSTFYRPLPPNVQCQVRCVMADSPEIEMTRQSQNSIVWDLTKPLATPTSRFAPNARLGTVITGKAPRTAIPVDAGGSQRPATEPPRPETTSHLPRLDQKRPPLLPEAVTTNNSDLKPKRSWALPVVSLLGLVITAAAFGVLFVPGLKEQLFSALSPELPPDIVKPLPDDVGPPTENPGLNNLKSGTRESDRVFDRMIPPMVLNPPTVPQSVNLMDVPDSNGSIAAAESPGAPLGVKDISLSPQWQSLQKSRFPQPMLLVRRSISSLGDVRLKIIDVDQRLKLEAAGHGVWRLDSEGRELGTLRWVDHELGTQLEFQCHVDDAGAATAFLDDMDLLNRSELEVAGDRIPAIRFSIATELIQGHLNLATPRSPGRVEFGIGGDQVIDLIGRRDVMLTRHRLNAISDAGSDFAANGLPAQTKNGVEPTEGQPNQLVVEFPIEFKGNGLENFTLQEMEAIAGLAVKIKLTLFKSVGQPLRYRWGPVSLRVAQTEVPVASWKFHQHPVNILVRELKKQLKQIKQSSVSTVTATGQDTAEVAMEIEELTEFLESMNSNTSKMLKLADLLPSRLLDPIEMQSVDGARCLLFLDIGSQGKWWSNQEMRMAWHGKVVE